MPGSSDAPKGGIPSWQRQENRSPTESSDAPASKPPAQSSEELSATEAHDAPASKPPPSVEKPSPEESKPDSAVQADLMLKALRFLQDESLRNASVEEKLGFLEGKGLDATSINSLKALLSNNQPASNTRVVSPEQIQGPPPIITYPEFMMHSSKPPPLITTQRLLNTAYVATGAAALVYGLSEYLVKPMAESLTLARHDVAGTAQEKLSELNDRLVKVVSKDPAQGLLAALPQHLDGDEDGSIDSDPTELFHRDFGTQTSPDLEGKTKSTDSDSSSEASESKDVTTQHSEKVQRIRALASDLSGSHLAGEGESTEEISTVIRVLNEYLDGMAYPSTGSYGAYGGVFDSSDNATKKNHDAIAKIKTEIRGVKGIFLSARNFPSTGPAALKRTTP